MLTSVLYKPFIICLLCQSRSCKACLVFNFLLSFVLLTQPFGLFIMLVYNYFVLFSFFLHQRNIIYGLRNNLLTTNEYRDWNPEYNDLAEEQMKIIEQVLIKRDMLLSDGNHSSYHTGDSAFVIKCKPIIEFTVLTKNMLPHI